MKLRSIFLSLIFIAGVTNGLSAKLTYTEPSLIDHSITGIQQDYQTHIVAKGETAYSIASAYNTTVQEIYRLNPKAEKGIKAGDKLLIPKAKEVVSGYKNHTIQSQETLYGISRQYTITIEDLVAANPGLNESTFKAGKTILIPLYDKLVKSGFANPNIEHKVEKGETLYSISKAYDVSIETLFNSNPSLSDKGLKEGSMLSIPRKQVTPLPVAVKDVAATSTIVNHKDNVVRIGILLPFLEEGGSIQKEKIIEYYEGFLLAVKELKEKGLNAEIYTFDIGSEKNTKRLESILGTTEANSLSLIIGGISKQQIEVLSKFAKKKEIKYIIPFGSAGSEVDSNPFLYQATNSHSNLYSDISEAFISRFRDYNVIFVSEAGSDNNKSDFVSVLKKELAKANISYETTASSASLITDLEKVLAVSKKNILIPTSSSEMTLRRLMPALKSIPEGTSMTLFGYPEWQTYSSYTENFHNYNAYIYSIFYLNEQQESAQNFIEQYKKWYTKSLINSYPKYGYLGYDSGLYFLTALNRYGNNFESGISSLRVPTLQLAMHFSKVNARGGYINNGLYFVHYKTDSSIEKIDCSNK
ncbi:LysM peptidoglycan-binding domain-containing protein [Dysgonomonas sp. ZJ279]|uniref:lytic transglycosylase n=1 Tax=Dysgonomonas sp. ZJ279 TaxID=2709796 RepID=UPI0013ECC9BD|nr:LysM peptidoglycan-binding domain-containing protein [Dysgonomonas sp. ZJ279]